MEGLRPGPLCSLDSTSPHRDELRLTTHISPILLHLPPPPPKPSAAPDGLPSCAVYYANLAACELKIEGHASQAAGACSDAIELDPAYSKAYMRRSAAFEAMDDLDNALTDAKKVGVV